MLFIAGFCLLLCSALGARTVEQSCPKEALEVVDRAYFKVFDDTCFLFMTYDPVDFLKARAKCGSNGGSLAMPKTQALHDFLSEKMMGFRYDAEAIWIGAHDMKEEETYVWEDGSEMEFQDNMNRWNGGWFGGDEDCIALKKGDREWHDYPCGHELPFICQYPIQVQEEGQDGEDEGNTEGQDGEDEAVKKVQDGEDE